MGFAILGCIPIIALLRNKKTNNKQLPMDGGH
jgi:hypothetical protein